MKRAFLLLLLSTLSLLGDEPWPGVPFTEVRAYAWRDDKETEAVILPGMTLKPGLINKEGALLIAEQVKVLLSAVTGKHTWHPVAACFYPHNAFVFYDAAKKPVASIELCFGCFNHRIEPAGTSQYLDFISLASLFGAHELPMGEYPDFEAFEKDFTEANRGERNHNI